jgi:hypothetical protein
VQGPPCSKRAYSFSQLFLSRVEFAARSPGSAFYLMYDDGGETPQSSFYESTVVSVVPVVVKRFYLNPCRHSHLTAHSSRTQSGRLK